MCSAARRRDHLGELQNLLERAVIMCSGPELRLPLDELKRVVAGNTPVANRTLEAVEREHVLHVLEQADWVVGGRNGAAVRLGLPRTTLISRMRKLGIAKGTMPVVAAAAAPG